MSGFAVPRVLQSNGLVEHKVDTLTGKQLTGDKAEWVVENRYEKLTPGEEVDKDPTVFIGATSEDAWLFVTVTKSADYDAIDFSDEFVELGTVKDSENKEYTLLRSVAKVSAPEAGKVDAGHQVFSNVKVNKDIEFINNKLVYTVNDKKVEKDELDKIYVKAALVQYDGLEDEAGQAEALAAAKKLLEVK